MRQLPCRETIKVFGARMSHETAIDIFATQTHRFAHLMSQVDLVVYQVGVLRKPDCRDD